MTAPYSRPWFGSADSGGGRLHPWESYLSTGEFLRAPPDRGVGTGRRRMPGLRDVRRTRRRMSRGFGMRPLGRRVMRSFSDSYDGDTPPLLGRKVVGIDPAGHSGL